MRGKRLAALSLAAVMAFGVTSVGGNEAKAAEVPTLSVLTFADWYGEGMKALEAYINENAEELGFNIEIDAIAGGSEGEELLRAKFATGDLPDLLVSYGAKWLDNSAHVLEQMVPLKNVDMSEYDQALLESGRFIYKGELYNVPVETATLFGVFYNKDVFAAAGITEVPTNWAEFEACCETLKEAGVTPVYYSGADSWTLQTFTHFGFNQDVIESGLSFADFWGEMNTNQRHYTDAANFKASLQLSKDIIDKGYVNETYLSDSYDMCQTALAEGTAAMHINGTWFYDEVISKYPEAGEHIGSFVLPLYDENYVISSIPRSIGMTEACEDQELGQKALNFIASSTAQQIYADAQPGIYWNQKVTCELPEAYTSLYDEMLAGNSMMLWQSGNIYGYGDYGTHVQDFLAGGMEIDQVIELLDSDTAENAKVAGDANWE